MTLSPAAFARVRNWADTVNAGSRRFSHSDRSLLPALTASRTASTSARHSPFLMPSMTAASGQFLTTATAAAPAKILVTALSVPGGRVSALSSFRVGIECF